MIPPTSSTLSPSFLESSEEKKRPKTARRPFEPPLTKSIAQPSRKQSIFDLAKQKERAAKQKLSPIPEASPPTSPPQGLPILPPLEEGNQVTALTGIEAPLSLLLLSPAMQELATSLDNWIVLEQNKGVSTIEIQLEGKGKGEENTFLEGTTVRIEHYDTHPHSFNIQLFNQAPSIVLDLTTQLPTLLQALQHRLPHFHIHLLPPAYPALSEIKGSSKLDKSVKRSETERQKKQSVKRNSF